MNPNTTNDWNELGNAQNKKLPGILLLTIFAILVFSSGYILGYIMNIPRALQKNSQIDITNQDISNSDMNIFYEVYSNIRRDYIKEEVDKEELIYGSTRGLVESLGDKYSTFYSPEESKELQNQNASRLEGIGTTLGFNGEYTIIETPFDEFPAQKAGLMPGDYILEVDSEDMRYKRPQYVASKIIGESGTTVKLKVYRDDDRETYDKEIIRALIDLDNIDYEDLGDNIFKINIHQFTESTVSEFNSSWDEIVSEINSKNPKGIILDLRNNSGGYVSSAVHVASEFLPKGTLIMTEEDRVNSQVQTNSYRDGKMKDLPLVILINGGSASASEIVAGALQDHKRGDLIGQNTLGKGVEQKVIELSDGSTMYLVYKRWLTPAGHNVSFESPLEPDIFVDYTTQDFEKKIDPQLEKGVEVVKSK